MVRIVNTARTAVQPVDAKPAKRPVSKPKVVHSAPSGKLYLAYGSNLHKRQMRTRCPTARPLGGILLHDAKLVFRGVADVTYAPGRMVPCGLWRIQRQDEEALDRYEGVAGGLYVKEMVELSDGQEALIYMMTAQGIAPPSEYYADVLRQGYRDFELNENYLNEALRHSWLKKEHDDATQARRARQRKTVQHHKLARMPERVAIDIIERRTAAVATEEKYHANGKTDNVDR